jgi:hypothetical protein
VGRVGSAHIGAQTRDTRPDGIIGDGAVGTHRLWLSVTTPEGEVPVFVKTNSSKVRAAGRTAWPHRPRARARARRCC